MTNQSSLDGRITYQCSGETFYIPYSLNDVVTPTQLRIGDRVKFYIAQNNNVMFPLLHMPMGTYYARRVELIMSQHQQQQQQLQQQQHQLIQQLLQQNTQQQVPKQLFKGIITNLKDSFGKIEREDLFKEYFFHFTEYKGKNPAQELRIGLNVEFEIQDKFGKDQACNIKMLPDGSVSFDEISPNIYIGRIVQALPSKVQIQQNASNQIMSIGRLIYDNNDENLVELTFNERDRIASAGEYTLLEGDFVQFRIATDKRKRLLLQGQPNLKLNSNQLSQLQRATNITLIEEHSLIDNSANTKEHRETGVLVRVHAGSNETQFGVIKCIEQEDFVFFPFDEIISFVKFSQVPNEQGEWFTVDKVKLEIGDSLEFSVVKCQKDSVFKNGLKAIRVRQLAKNSVKFEVISSETYTGFIEKEAGALSSGDSQEANENMLQGVIRYDMSSSGTNSTGLANKKIIFYVPKFDKNNNSNANNGNNVGSNRSSSISSSNSSGKFSKLK